MATAAKAKVEKEPEVKATGRSASYPFIDLESAVGRLEEFWKEEKAYEVPIASAYKHWGYGAKSSGARLTLAAMLNYGLLVDKGSNEQRTVKVTPLGIDILMPPSEEAKARALKIAAQKPRIFAELLKTMDPENLPSNQTLGHFLVTQKGFNPNSIQTFIKNFKGTIEYAKLNKSDIMSVPADPSSGNVGAESGAGLVKEVNLLHQNQSSNPSTPLPPSTALAPKGFKQDVYHFVDGGQVILQWPEGMSKENFGEFEDWIKLELRKIARAVKPANE